MKCSGDIYPSEIRSLIKKLIRFLGPLEVDKQLRRYLDSLKSSGPIFAEYYVKNCHPWWEALSSFYEIERAGKSIKKHLSYPLKRLAGDAKKVSFLTQQMPPAVRNKFKKDLIKKDRAHDFLYELYVAWHFCIKGCEIDWYESDSSTHPEFMVRCNPLNFNVECKRISMDFARKVHRKEFYRIADRLLPNIDNLGLTGTVNIFLVERLHSDDQHIRHIADSITKTIKNGGTSGNFDYPFGTAHINFHKLNSSYVDEAKLQQELFTKKAHNAYGAVLFKSLKGSFTNPIALTIQSEKGDNILSRIEYILMRTIKRQLPSSAPGLLCCYLEGINHLELTQLKSNSGLQMMTNSILDKKSSQHIAAISYASEGASIKTGSLETFFNQGLIFRNPNCKFKEAINFDFLSKP